MSCCGQRREAIAANYRAPEVHSQLPLPNASLAFEAARAAPVQPAASVTLLSRERGVLSVTGPITGTAYYFPGSGSMQPVDRQDVEALLATGSFERVWG